MKITDKLETVAHDPVVERGDILKVIRQYETYKFRDRKSVESGRNAYTQ